MQNLLAKLSFLAFALSAESHVYMGYPPTFMANRVSTDDLISPMNGGPTHPDQWPFPCKGFHLADAEMQPGVVWRAGETVKFRNSLFDSDGTPSHHMSGLGAIHSGGSCQISFSYDRGLSWVVVQSFEGDCPRVRPGMKGTVTNDYDPNQDYYFKIPETFPSGDYVIVAWTWINATGRREFYMSCSPVKITGSGPSTNVTPEGHPLMIANMNPLSGDTAQANALLQCRTQDSTSVEYPDRYKGFNAVIRAPVALNLQPFPGGNRSCSSDNPEIVEALSESIKVKTSSMASTVTSLMLPERLISPSAIWFPARNTTTAFSEVIPSTTTPEGSECMGSKSDVFLPEGPSMSTFLSDPQKDQSTSTTSITPDLRTLTPSNEQVNVPDLGGILSDLHSMLNSVLIAEDKPKSTQSFIKESTLHLGTAASPRNSCEATVTTTLEVKAT
ncbi:hypothetical protein B0J12DRAFT_756340 [Macrophomina phaseolina]|uniref:Lytic polysaccharide monooxygenase n=1 Tax=Macrophomina phaseolina TaxID=35725 RepID=A0ABQ8FP79_9PEZI|nr:hypothetical protein B0J12DRAFT_756340 [Macrophomina phaseolina]